MSNRLNNRESTIVDFDDIEKTASAAARAALRMSNRHSYSVHPDPRDEYLYQRQSLFADNTSHLDGSNMTSSSRDEKADSNKQSCSRPHSYIEKSSPKISSLATSAYTFHNTHSTSSSSLRNNSSFIGTRRFANNHCYSKRPSLFAQTWALIKKNFVLFRQNWKSTLLAALVIPTLFFLFLGEAKNFLQKSEQYGVGAYKSIPALSQTDLPSMKLLWWDMTKTTNSQEFYETFISDYLDATGRSRVRLFDNTTSIADECPQNYLGLSDCFALVMIDEVTLNPPKLRYMIRSDYGLSYTKVISHGSGIEKRLLPLQQALDSSFGKMLNPNALFPSVYEMGYTSVSQSDYEAAKISSFLGLVNSILGAAFFLGMSIVIYQLIGSICKERETRLTSLLSSMGCRTSARIISWHLSFTLLYLPGWVLMSMTIGLLLFKDFMGTVIAFHVVAGLVLVSWTIFMSTFFRRSMLSGASTIALGLSITLIAQLVDIRSDAAIVIFCVVFPPVSYLFGLFIFSDSVRSGESFSWTKADQHGSISLLTLVIIMIADFVVYPFIAALLEHIFYNLSAGAFTSQKPLRMVDPKVFHNTPHISIRHVTKTYRRHWWSFLVCDKGQKYTQAVQGLNLDLPRDAVTCLLGQNGSGKSTTIEILAGVRSKTSGEIQIDGQNINKVPNGTIAMCPQKNIFWKELTVSQNLEIFKQIKTVYDTSFTDKEFLIDQCDLRSKAKSPSDKLSGGQKRKLQMAIAFLGGPPICLMDEVSSGLDPVSRRVIWRILLDYRAQQKTIVMTTHYLDEAEVLSDYIAIMQSGKLKVSGSLSQLKARIGSGYTIKISSKPDANSRDEELNNLQSIISQLQSRFDIRHVQQIVPGEVELALGSDCQDIVNILTQIEGFKFSNEIDDYDVKGPSLNDIFLETLHNPQFESSAGSDSLASTIDEKYEPSRESTDSDLLLTSGRPTSILRQIWIILEKRLTLFKGNSMPLISTLFIALFFTGIGTSFLGSYRNDCQYPTVDTPVMSLQFPVYNQEVGNTFLYGPDVNDILYSGIPKQLIPLSKPDFISSGNQTSYDYSSDFLIMAQVNNLVDLRATTIQTSRFLNQGGLFYAGPTSPSTMSWVADENQLVAAGIYNLYSNVHLQKSVVPQANSNGAMIEPYFQAFEPTFVSQFTDALKFIAFIGISLAVFPAFSTLQPSRERNEKVKALHFSNGVKPAALLLAHYLWEIPINLLISAVITVILVVMTNPWHERGYIFPILFLYGIATTSLSFILTFRAKSALSSFAIAAGYQLLFFILYLALLFIVLTFGPPRDLVHYVNLVHFLLSIFSPICSVLRFFIMQLNIFSLSCKDNRDVLPDNWNAMNLYGGPIVYLVAQLVIFLLFNLWMESGFHIPFIFSPSDKSSETSDSNTRDETVKEEEARIMNTEPNDVLQVVQVSKSFKKSKNVIDNVTFGVDRGQCFALLGPNGAGKTTLFNVLRGALHAKHGHIKINGIQVNHDRQSARQQLGFCPQFDAFENMTVMQHIKFYASIKGVPREKIKNDAINIIKSVGLEPFTHQKARKLSGGNQRKLSLAIALLGNPSVILVDEASSGMDASVKRLIWQTLARIVPKRVLVLTTHSMEEADALASRVGILRSKLLAVGTISELRRKFCPDYMVQIELNSSNVNEHTIPQLDAYMFYHFPDSARLPHSQPCNVKYQISRSQNRYSVAHIFLVLDQAARLFNFCYHSVSQATLEDLFLAIV